MNTNIRTWIFRVLVLLVSALLVYTWFQPWWTAYVEQLSETAVIIHPYGFESLAPPEYAYLMRGAADKMPGWFTPFMWAYLGLAVAALLFSLFASSSRGISLGKFRMSLPTLLVAGVGFSFVIVALAAYLTISINCQEMFGMPINGQVYIEVLNKEASWVTGSLENGFWIACGVGPALLILAVLRRFIVGKSQTGA
jgi:hypothetical protein